MKSFKLLILTCTTVIFTACGGGSSTSESLITGSSISESLITSHNAAELIPATLQTLTVNFSKPISLDDIDVKLFELDSKRGQDCIIANVAVGFSFQSQRINELFPATSSSGPVSNFSVHDLFPAINLYSPKVKKELPINTSLSFDSKMLNVTIDPMRPNSDYEFALYDKADGKLLTTIPFKLSGTQNLKYQLMRFAGTNVEYIYDDQDRLSGAILYQTENLGNSCGDYFSPVQDILDNLGSFEEITPEVPKDDLTIALSGFKQHHECIRSYTKVIYSENNITSFRCLNGSLCEGDDGILMTGDDTIFEAKPEMIVDLNEQGSFDRVQSFLRENILNDINANYNVTHQISKINEVKYRFGTAYVDNNISYTYDSYNNVAMTQAGDTNTSYTYDENSMVSTISYTDMVASYETSGTRILQENLFPNGLNESYYTVDYDTYRRPEIIKLYTNDSGNINETTQLRFVYTDDKTLSHVFFTDSNYNTNLQIFE